MKSKVDHGSRLGLFLILIGALFLISKLEIFEFSFSILGFIGALISMWPITLIIIGISILFNKHTIIKVILWGSFLIFILFYSSFGERFNGFGGFNSFEDFHFFIENGEIRSDWDGEGFSRNSMVHKNEDAEKGEIFIELGACKFDLKDTHDNVFEVKSNIKELSHRNDYDEKSKTEKIEIWEEKISEKIKSRYVDLKLNEDLLWDIDADLGALDAELDMSELKVNTFTLNIGAGNIDLYLGSENPHIKAYVDGGVSNISIHIPEDSGIKVKKEGTLMHFTDKIGLEEKGSELVSPNYDEADEVVELYLNAAAANITIDHEKH